MYFIRYSKDKKIKIKYLEDNIIQVNNKKYKLNKKSILIKSYLQLNLIGGLGNRLFIFCTSFAYSNNYLKEIEDLKNISLSNIINYSSEITYKPYNEKEFHYNKLIYQKGNLYLNGYFQSYKYFDKYKDDIIEFFKIQKIRNLYRDKVLEDSVSLHFRTGDYKKFPDCHPILPLKYYIESIKFIHKKKQISNIYVFYQKEDFNEVNENVKNLKKIYTNINFIFVNDNYKDWEELLIMSLCRDNIIANSTFSWWGAYFNLNKDKIVCYPDLWFGEKYNYHNMATLCPKDWSLICIYNSLYDLVDHIYYINLKHRKDRRILIEDQLRMIDPQFKKTTRFDAFKNNNGALGCSMSHCGVIKDAIEKKYNRILIFEDDFRFCTQKFVMDKYIKSLKQFDDNFNICCLSRNLVNYKKLNKDIIECHVNYSASCYIVNNKIFEKYRELLEYGIENLKKGGKDTIYINDVMWLKLQGKGNKFYTFTEPLGKQIPSYSDLCKQFIDHGV